MRAGSSKNTMAEPTDVSVVIPVYGSADIMPELVQQLEAMLSRVAPTFEVILVNDCSPDASWRTIVELAAARPWLKGIDLRKNAGQHNAIMAGLHAAKGRRVVLMDDDLQHSPDDVPKLLARLDEGFDVCYAAFRERRHRLWKRLGSAFNDRVARFLLKKPPGLYLSPFKALRGEIVRELTRYDGPNVYLDGLILTLTTRIGSVEVQHHARYRGESAYGLRRSISLWLKMATSFSIAPLRVASWVGLGFSVLGFVFAVLLVIQRFTLNAMPVGWSSIMVALLIVGGIQLLALGAIGEYLGRLFLAVNGRPQFVIGKKVNLDE